MKLVRKIKDFLHECVSIFEQYSFGFMALALLISLFAILMGAYIAHMSPVLFTLSFESLFASYTSFVAGLILFLAILWFCKSVYLASKLQARGHGKYSRRFIRETL